MRNTLFTLLLGLILGSIIYFQGGQISDLQASLKKANIKLSNQEILSSRQYALKTYLIYEHKLTPVKAARISTWAIKYGDMYGVDPYLTVSLIKAESYFKYNALSKKGALNVMQIMPFWAKRLPFIKSVTDLHNPEKNIQAGTFIIRLYMEQCGGLEAGLKCYHGGPRTMVYSRPQTINYVRSVLAQYNTI